MEKILVSACLAGARVRYDGSDNYCDNSTFFKLLSKGRIITICPEVASGCSIPRPPVEIVGTNSGAGVFNGTSRAMTKDGTDVSDMFISGAEIAFDLVLKNNIKIAILKSKSPSCGSSGIYDGSFSRTVIDGYGVTTYFLKQKGIEVYSEKEIPMVAERIKMLENLHKK